MATLKLDLADGTSIYAEVRPATNGGGRTREVSNKSLEANFGKVSNSIGQIAESLEVQLKAMAKRPHKVVIEFGAELKGEADLWLVSGEAKGHIKVTMEWITTRTENPS